MFNLLCTKPVLSETCFICQRIYMKFISFISELNVIIFQVRPQHRFFYYPQLIFTWYYEISKKLLLMKYSIQVFEYFFPLLNDKQCGSFKQCTCVYFLLQVKNSRQPSTEMEDLCGILQMTKYTIIIRRFSTGKLRYIRYIYIAVTFHDFFFFSILHVIYNCK